MFGVGVGFTFGVFWNSGGNEIGGVPTGPAGVGGGLCPGPGDGVAFWSTVGDGGEVGVGVGVGGTYLPQGVIGGGNRPCDRAHSCNSGG